MQFIQCYKADRSGTFEKSVDKLGPFLKPSLYTCEIFKTPTRTKPYYDIESYHANPPTPEDIDTQRSSIVEAIEIMFSTQPSAIKPDIIFASRHGRSNDPKKKETPHKISHRAYVTNYSVDYTIMSDVITMGGFSDLFDTSVYKSSEQLLGCINCDKLSTDRRTLVPEDSTIPLKDFIVQHLTGFEEPFVLVSPPPSQNITPPTTPTPHPRSAAVAAAPTTRPSIRLGGEPNSEPVVKYLQLLSQERWDTYDSWVKIAMALKNDYEDLYKSTWIDLSRTHPFFDLSLAESVWDSVCRETFTGRPLTFATIRKWASEDDPDGYAEVRASAVPAFILENHTKGDRGLSEIIAGLLRKTVKRCSKDDFYTFDSDENVWKKGAKDTIMNLVSHTLEDAILNVERYYVSKAATTIDQSAKEVFIILYPYILNHLYNTSILPKVFDKAAENAKKLINSSRKFTTISHMRDLVAPLIYDSDFENSLDSKPNLLGVRNGVVDLKTGILRDREPEDLIYHIVDTDYDVNADTSLMVKFISDIMAGNERMIKFLQKFLGYAITGEILEELFAIFNGDGRNGKGVISQLFSDLFGRDLVTDMPASLISGDQNLNNTAAEIWKMDKARIAYFKELPPNSKLKTDRVQLFSGGDGVPCCGKYRDATTIKPRHQCILETNHMPDIAPPILPSIIERLVVIHFPVSFVAELNPGETPSAFRRLGDPMIKAKLHDSHPGVLRWLVEGAMEWYATKDLKRNAPPEVKDFTKKYLFDQDLVQQFLVERCELHPSFRVGSVFFLASFNEWAFENDPERKKACGASEMVVSMRSKGFIKENMRVDGVPMQGYSGVSVLPKQPVAPRFVE